MVVHGRLYQSIAKAISSGKLVQPFRSADIERSCPGFATNTYRNFLAKHAVGNPSGAIELFKRIEVGAYCLQSDNSWSAKNRLEPQFLFSLGRFVATVGDFEDILLTTAWRLRSTEQKPASEWDQIDVEKIYDRFEKGLTDQLFARLELFKESYQDRFTDWEDQNLDKFLDEANVIREYRNCFCHCSWQRTNKKGVCRAKYVSRKESVLDEEFDSSKLNELSDVIEHLTHSLSELMGVKGIHP